MNTNYLRYFVEVAQQKSISKASKKLFISQPSLSMAITALEDELNNKLFYRSKSGVELTIFGEKILGIANRIIKDVQQMQNLGLSNEMINTVVHIVGIPSALNSLIVNLVKKAKIEYPNLKLEFIEKRPFAVIDIVSKGNANLGISSYFYDKEDEYAKVFMQKNLKTVKLYDDELYVFVRKDSSLAKNKDIAYADLQQYCMAGFDADSLDITKEHDNNLKISYSMNSLSSIKKLVDNDLALALLPLSFYDDDSEWVPVKIADKNMTVAVVLLYKDEEYLSLEDEIVINLIKELV